MSEHREVNGRGSEREKGRDKNAVTVVILVLPRPAVVPAPVWHNRVRSADQSKLFLPQLRTLFFSTIHSHFLQCSFSFLSYPVLTLLHSLCLHTSNVCDPGNSVGIATELRAGRSGDRIPVGGEIFRTCPDRPWGSPSLLYNGYQVFPGVKSGRGVTLTPQPSSAVIMKG